MTVCAIVIAISIATAIGAVSIRNLGNSDAKQMLLLLGEAGEKNLNSYFDSVEHSVSTLSALVNKDFDQMGNQPLTDRRLEAHMDRMRAVFEKTANRTNGVLTYYYRIDPAFSETVPGFWYTKLEGSDPDFVRAPADCRFYI